MFANVFINGLIAWLIFAGENKKSVDISAIQFDLVLTGFLLPFITVILAFGIVGKQVRKGKLPKLAQGYTSKFDILPSAIFARATVMGIFGILFMVVPVILIIKIGGGQSIDVMDFVYFKGAWAGITALLISPIAGWWALVKYSR